jgi:hypothetical protein
MRRLSLKGKSFAFILLIAVLLSGLAVSICYKVYINTLDEHYKTMATNIARTAAVMMDGDKIVEYARTLETDEDYDRMLDILFQIKNNNECKYLYIQRLSAEAPCTLWRRRGGSLSPGQVDPWPRSTISTWTSRSRGCPVYNQQRGLRLAGQRGNADFRFPGQWPPWLVVI